MSFIRLSLAILCLLSVSVHAAPAHSVLDTLIRDYERVLRDADPVGAGMEGDEQALRRLPDVSPQAQAALRESLVRLKQRADALNTQDMGAREQLDYALLSNALGSSIEELSLDLQRIAFLNDSGFHTLMDYLARTTRLRSSADAQAWLQRLAAVPAYYQQNLDNLRRGIRTGYTQPRIVVERVIEVAQRQVDTPAQDSSLLMPFDSIADGLSAEAGADYRRQALALIDERIRPAQQQFLKFLQQEYLPAARASLAVRSVPEGERIYRFLARNETTTDMTPDEIHALGQSEVARIRGLMEQAIRRLQFEGSFAEFLAFLRSDPRFYARDAQQLLEKASEIAKRADDQLPRFFGTLPRLPYGVRAVPDDIAPGYTTGRYWRGSMSQGQAGGYMVNTAFLDQRPLYELPALTLHEAVPGHHLQIALSQELEDLPYFRRNISPTAFVEGWGLYSEFLGEQMGIYRDDYELFGRYSYEMWRACRLVADTGIHWLGWDIEQARTCFTDNSALAPHNIQTELERYIAWPGQALAYKIGELRLRELRAKAEQALGERFDVRKFHDTVLLGGALPLNVLEQRVQQWVDSQQPHP